MSEIEFTTHYPINHTSHEVLFAEVTIGIRHLGGGIGHGQPIDVILDIKGGSSRTPEEHAEIIGHMLAEAGWLDKTNFDRHVGPQRAFESNNYGYRPTLELLATAPLG